MLLSDIIGNKMTLDGVGDEVFHCFVALIIIVVVYVAWWTTNIPDRGHSRAVFLLDRSPRSNQTLTRHTHVTSVREALANILAPLIEESDLPSTSVDPPTTLNQSTDVKPPEGSTNRANRAEVLNQTGVNTREEQVIIEAMDANINALGQRDPIVNSYCSDSDEDESDVPVMLVEEKPPSTGSPSSLDQSTEGSSNGAEVEDQMGVDEQQKQIKIKTMDFISIAELRQKQPITNVCFAGDGEGKSRNGDSDEGNQKTCEANVSAAVPEESHPPSNRVEQPVGLDQSTERSSNGVKVEDREGINPKEEQVIIETMDAGTNELRQRKKIVNGDCTNSEERSTNSQIEQISSRAGQIYETGDHDAKLENEIVVKLKYLNDDIKTVSGSLEESLDNFKKRHFPDLSANKIVKFIFNGRVLQPDTQTLKTCGLYQDCVVHCLIQNKSLQSNAPPVGESRREVVSLVSFPMINQIPRTNNDRHRDWDLGNLLFGLISLMLFLAWYFRYVYAHMYTATATIGLILVTVIFAIFVVGTLFPDIENFPNLTFHVAQERGQTRQ